MRWSGVVCRLARFFALTACGIAAGWSGLLCGCGTDMAVDSSALCVAVWPPGCAPVSCKSADLLTCLLFQAADGSASAEALFASSAQGCNAAVAGQPNRPVQAQHTSSLPREPHMHLTRTPQLHTRDVHLECMREQGGCCVGSHLRGRLQDHRLPPRRTARPEGSAGRAAGAAAGLMSA